jgi:hypothetical protein
MIKNIIRLQNNMVMVFDEFGEEMPEYQGSYYIVKDRIIADATDVSVFNHWFGFAKKPYKVEMKCW